MNGAPADAEPGVKVGSSTRFPWATPDRIDLTPPQAPAADNPANGVPQHLDTMSDDTIIMEWQNACGKIPAEHKESVRQVLNRRIGHVFEVDFVVEVSWYMRFFKTNYFHPMAIWVLRYNRDLSVDDPELQQIEPMQPDNAPRGRKGCRCHQTINPRPSYSDVDMPKLLIQAKAEIGANLERAGRFEFPMTPLQAVIERENARRAIEWHERFQVWRRGWIYHDDEQECRLCPPDNEQDI